MKSYTIFEEDKQAAHEYEFDVGCWKHADCVFSMWESLKRIFEGSEYICEKSTGKEKCLNINKRSVGNKTRGRIAGIYIIPTKGCVSLVLSKTTFAAIQGYNIPKNTQEDNGQFHFCHIDYPTLCAFCRLIIDN